MKRLLIPGLSALLLAAPAFADVFEGCVDSPENPTLLLALLGALGAGWPRLRRLVSGLRKS